MKKILLSPDPVEGGDPAASNPPQDPKKPETATPPPANPPPKPAPAAETVLEGDRTERELELEERLRKKDADIKDRETKICHLEDQVHKLTAPPTSPAPTAETQDGYRWRPFKS